MVLDLNVSLHTDSICGFTIPHVNFKKHAFSLCLLRTGREHLKQSSTTEVHVVKAMVFPVVMYGCENGELTFLKCGAREDS